MEPNFITIPNFTASPSPPSPFIPVPAFYAPPSPPSPFIPVPAFYAPPSPPSPSIPAFQDPPSPPSAFIPAYEVFDDPPSPPSPYVSTPSPPKARLPKPKNSNSPESGTLMITGAIVIFFFLLWVGVTLYRRHQRRRRQRSQQGGDGPNDNAEAVQEPADLPLTSRNRRWETQMQLEEHEERPFASGRNQVEIQLVDDLPPAPAFSQRPPSPSAPPLPEHLSEQVLPAPARNEPRRLLLAE